MNQIVLNSKNNYLELDNYIKENKINNIFVVCFDIIKQLKIYKYLENLNIKITYFNDFKPNPSYESVCLGVEKFKESKSDCIIAIGGGSALDVGKCIKLFSTLNPDVNYLEQKLMDNNIKLLAVPTTAGTGSEATKYAVIYYNGIKQSITHDSCIPSVVLFDSSLLETLPLYQKKATVFDAFSHGIESLWSINSTEESKKYSIKALEIIIKNIEFYLNDEKSVYDDMLKASNLAGKAINITQTTAGHAMCYKLTSLYDISHGHAAILVNSELLPFMINNLDKCIDDRGMDHLLEIFNKLTNIFNLDNIEELSCFLRNLVDKYDLYDVDVNNEDIELLVNSVNLTRLGNNPVKLDSNDIKEIYLKIFKEVEKRKNNGSK